MSCPSGRPMKKKYGSDDDGDNDNNKLYSQVPTDLLRGMRKRKEAATRGIFMMGIVPASRSGFFCVWPFR